MSKITLIGSYHADCEECNSLNLSYIIEKISPDVIFLECPLSEFDEYYFGQKSSLESHAICLLFSRHFFNRPSLIPVDIDITTEEEFNELSEYFLKSIYCLNSNYRNLSDSFSLNVRNKGFKFLNSKDAEKMNLNQYYEIEKTIKKENNARLTKDYNRWKEIMEKRENAMLENIYSYCEKNEVTNGLYLVGAAHRKSLYEKIHTRNSDLIEWEFP